MDQNALNQSDCSIFKLTLSPEQNDERADILDIDADSEKLKVDWKISAWLWSKMGMVFKVLEL